MSPVHEIQLKMTDAAYGKLLDSQRAKGKPIPRSLHLMDIRVFKATSGYDVREYDARGNCHKLGVFAELHTAVAVAERRADILMQEYDCIKSYGRDKNGIRRIL